MKSKKRFKNQDFDEPQEKTKGNRKYKKQEKREAQSLIEGIITASGWDDNGKVTEIKLQTIEEDEYHIINGDLFSGLVRKYVLVSGNIGTQKNGTKTIHIKKCTILENQQNGELVIENMA